MIRLGQSKLVRIHGKNGWYNVHLMKDGYSEQFDFYAVISKKRSLHFKTNLPRYQAGFIQSYSITWQHIEGECSDDLFLFNCIEALKEWAFHGDKKEEE